LAPASSSFRASLWIAGLCLALSACALHWPPWKHRPQPPPPPVTYVTVVSQSGAITQYWDRNTLQLDLTALSGEGSASVSQIKSVGWPIRLEVLVRPGSFARLEVVGAQRDVFEVPPQGANLVFKLVPDLYPSSTDTINLRWSAADGSGR
jgi:hypothetical protein